MRGVKSPWKRSPGGHGETPASLKSLKRANVKDLIRKNDVVGQEEFAADWTDPSLFLDFGCFFGRALT